MAEEQNKDKISAQEADDPQKKYNIDFYNLIDEYKKNYFNDIPMIDHEFLHCAIHPLNPDYVFCLEKNIYPKNLKITDIYSTNDQGNFNSVAVVNKQKTQGQDDLDFEVGEDKPDKKNIIQGASNAIKGGLVKQNFSSSLQEGILEKTTGKNNEFPQVTKANDAQETKQQKDEIKKDPELKTIEFNDPLQYEEFYEPSTDSQFQFAISKWKINKGRNCVQVREFGFKADLTDNKFYFSENGKYIYFFQSEEDVDENTQFIRKLTILNIEDFEVVQSFIFQQAKYQIKQIYESFLWNNANYLYLGFYNKDYDYEHIVIDLKRKQNVLEFKYRYSDLDLTKEEKIEYIKGLGYGYELDENPDAWQDFEYNIWTYKVAFKNDDSSNIYILTKSYDEKVWSLFKCPLNTKISAQSFSQKGNQKLERLFELKNENSVSSIKYSSDLNAFIFQGLQSMEIFFFKDFQLQQTKVINCNSDKIHFQQSYNLNNDCLFMYQDDKTDLLCYSTKYQKAFITKGFSSAQYLFDLQLTNSSQLIAIGQSFEQQCNLVINYVEDAHDNYKEKDINTAFIAGNFVFQLCLELSEPICLYPNIIYCKGNKELYIQSLHFPQMFKRFVLDDIGQGTIVKSCVLQTRYNEASLVMQFRHKIVIKSFNSKYIEIYDRSKIANVPFIFLPNAQGQYDDKLLILFKEGNNVTIQKYQDAEEQYIYFIHSTESLTKNSDLFGYKEIIDQEYISEMRGPYAVPNANSILYLVKNYNPYFKDDEEPPKNKQPTILNLKKSKTINPKDVKLEFIDKYQQDLIEEYKLEGEEKTIQTETCNMSQIKYKEKAIEDSQIRGVKTRGEENLLLLPQEDENFDVDKLFANEAEDTKVSIVMIPYVDSNKQSLFYQSNNIGEGSSYPMITRSSFIDQEENIMVTMNDNYYLFSKFGKLKGKIFFAIEKNGFYQIDRSLNNIYMKWIYMSDIPDPEDPNQNVFFLFHNKKSNNFITSELIKIDPTDQEQAQYIFLIRKKVNIYQSLFTSEGSEISYFNQVVLNNQGEVIQIKLLKEKGKDSLDSLSQFQMYIDNNQVFEDRLAGKFSLYSQVKNENVQYFGYTIINDYLFVKLFNQIEYLKVFDQGKPLTNQALQSSSSKILNLNMDSMCSVKRILSTQNIRKQPYFVKDDDKSKICYATLNDKVQIIYTHYSTEEEQARMYVVTWDLQKNIEHQSLELDILEEEMLCSHHLVVKGMSEKYNYIVTEDSFYDLQYMVPMKCLYTNESQISADCLSSINERKLSRDRHIYLGISNLNTIFQGYTMQNLIYMSNLMHYKANEIYPTDIFLDQFYPRYAGSTLFHKFANEQKFYKLLYEEYKKNDDEESNNQFQSLLFHIIYPNSSGLKKESPIDIAIASQNPKVIEIMLQMLIDLQGYKLSQFVKKHFTEIFEMNLTVFETYLGSCLFQTSNMKDIKSLNWKENADEIVVHHTCSFLSEDIIKQKFPGYKIPYLEDELNQSRQQNQKESLKIFDDQKIKELQNRENKEVNSEQNKNEEGEQDKQNENQSPENKDIQELQSEQELIQSERNQQQLQEENKNQELSANEKQNQSIKEGSERKLLDSPDKEEPDNSEGGPNLFKNKLNNAVTNLLIAQSVNKSQIHEMYLYHPDLQQDQEKNEDMKRVEVQAVEFDWIFYGPESRSFISRLAYSDNDNLFTVETIRIIVTYLWEQYFNRIVSALFVPFIIYICFLCVYITYIYEMKVNDPENNKWKGLDIFFIVVVLVSQSFFMALEIRQMISQGIKYFAGVWNWFDICSWGLNIAFVVCDLTNVDPLKVRPIGATAVAVIWIRLFYFLRLFTATSDMIRMVSECTKDMGSFGFVLALVMIAWGNVFFILDINCYNKQVQDYDPSSGPFEEPAHFIGQGNFLISLIYAFNMGLGNFQTDYQGLQNEAYLWILFLLIAIVIQIILLNLLISILGDTFGRVSSIKDLAKMKEQCQLIEENDYLFNREKFFKEAKYLIVYKLEKARNNASSVEGQVAQLKGTLTSMMNEAKTENKLIMEGLKQEVLAGYKGIDSKISENQSSIQRTKQNVDSITKVMDNISNSFLQTQNSIKQLASSVEEIKSKIK